MSKVTITRYRKGQLSLPYLYCPNYDTLSGTLFIRHEGAVRLQTMSTATRFYADVKLMTNVDILDLDHNIILSPDGSHNIDQLGRIDAVMTSDASHFQKMYSGAECYIDGGTLETTRWVYYRASNGVMTFIIPTIARKHFGGIVKLVSITIYYYTDNNSAYISQTRITRHFYDAVNYAYDITDTDDYGNGVNGAGNYTETLNRKLAFGEGHAIEFTIVGGASAKVYIAGFRCDYTLESS